MIFNQMGDKEKILELKNHSDFEFVKDQVMIQ
jgi:hypothetical protein